MIKRMLRSPQSIMVGFVLVVNALSALIASLVWIPLASSAESLNLSKHIYALIPLFIAIVVAILLSTVLSRRTAKPLNEMIDATKAISKGDYSIRVSEMGEGDIHKLLHSFNQMTAELGSTELMRNDFINTFSHEFKTPIVSIRGFAKRLRQGNLSQAKQNEYLDYIVSESQRLSDLSNNILLLSKYENQQLIGDQADYDLGEEIRRCVLVLEKQWEAKEINFDLNIPDELPYHGNEEMMDHIWLNLISNAIKFSGQGESIHIDAVCEHDAVCVTVRDEGCGISSEAINHIFDKFYQGDRAHAGIGSGLGLPLVHRIVDLCHGNITVESQEGHGTSVHVELPVHSDIQA